MSLRFPILRFTAGAFLLGLAPSGFSSEESYVPWQSITVSSAGNAETGAISVEASADADGCTALSISAFGKKESVSTADLKMLKGYPLSGLLITQEPGYEVIGGHTVHVRLARTVYENGKKLRTETVIISLPKKASLRVQKMPETHGERGANG